jgi:hypothetical protein
LGSTINRYLPAPAQATVALKAESDNGAVPAATHCVLPPYDAALQPIHTSKPSSLFGVS